MPDINPELLKNMNPDQLLQQAKKGQTLMAFVTVSGFYWALFDC